MEPMSDASKIVLVLGIIGATLLLKAGYFVLFLFAVLNLLVGGWTARMMKTITDQYREVDDQANVTYRTDRMVETMAKRKGSLFPPKVANLGLASDFLAMVLFLYGIWVTVY